MIKVVPREEMARIERGHDSALFMLEAGKKCAEAATHLLKSGKNIVLLIGKGNKGGDAYVAGIRLLEKGYRVRAIAFYEQCSELNRRFSDEFDRAGGERESKINFSEDDLIVDGLFGTGFQGRTIDDPVGAAIEAANRSGKPILSIDIPSGLNATTGETANHAVVATETVSLGLYKIGFFLKEGYNFVGRLQIADFGLPDDAVEEAKAVALVPKWDMLKLPEIHRTQHKYRRGFVAGFGGSAEFKGAVKLSGSAALHAGAGIVKLFTLEDVGAVLDELICQVWNSKGWEEALGKATAFFIGPGLGRSARVEAWLKDHLQKIEQPCVIDADALFFLPKIEHWSKQCILTPHRGEMLHLLGQTKQEDGFLEACQQFVDERQVIVVLKGAPTFVLSPKSLPIIIPRGDPGMATAGSGDVLTGILSALLAQGKPLLDAAVLGVVLHALSGEAASQEKTSYGYTASDLIAYLPKAFEQLM